MEVIEVTIYAVSPGAVVAVGDLFIFFYESGYNQINRTFFSKKLIVRKITLMADISHFYHLCSTRGNENDEISEYLLFKIGRASCRERVSSPV